jgi:hypothetical protein
MARGSGFLGAGFSRQFDRSYAELQHHQQAGVDKAILAILKGSPTPGLRVKPIEPDKYYLEARVNAGDRLIHRVEGGTVFFVDIVPHDLIRRYGRRRGR